MARVPWSMNEKVVVWMFGLLTAAITAGAGKIVVMGERQAGMVVRVDAIEQTLGTVNATIRETMPALDKLNDRAERILRLLHEQKREKNR